MGKSTRAKTDQDLRATLNQLCQLNELRAMFSSDTYSLMKSAATLLAPTFSGDSSMTDMTKNLNDVAKFFQISGPESELTVFLKQIARKRAKMRLSKRFLICWTYEVFPHINSILKALITLPMTSCTVERVFSSVNRIKTVSRSTMLTTRLNLIHYEHTYNALLSLQLWLGYGYNYDYTAL